MTPIDPTKAIPLGANAIRAAIVDRRRLQVIARLLDVTAMGGGYAADFVETTRADYPDVFADLDSHLRQVRDVATTEPDATVIDGSATLAMVRQLVPTDDGGLREACAPVGSDAADDLDEVRRLLAAGDRGNAWLAGGDALRDGARWSDEMPPLNEPADPASALALAEHTSTLLPDLARAWAATSEEVEAIATASIQFLPPTEPGDHHWRLVVGEEPTGWSRLIWCPDAGGDITRAVAQAAQQRVDEPLQRLRVTHDGAGSLTLEVATTTTTILRSTDEGATWTIDRPRPTGELPKRAALLPKEIYVDDIIGGIPTVRLTPPDGEPITFSLSAEGARVLGLALLSSAEISKVTGWGQTVQTQSNLPPAKCSLASPRAAAGKGDLTFTFDDSVLKATLHRASSNEPWIVTVGDPAPHTLAELRRRLDALPIRALLIIPASLDHSVVDAHFPGFFDGKTIGFANGSILKILRGRPEPRQIAGSSIDVALVLTAIPEETLKEIRLALLRSGGTLFAPFEAPLPESDPFGVAKVGRVIAAVAAACETLKADPDVVAPAAAAQRRARAGIPALVLETGGQCPCRECGGVLDVSVHGQDRAIQCSTPSCVRWIE